ncbi:hypothetical protein H9P43_009801 [Blastocladiella emersonii ATCC 22665]|nr:hypothetical protein H9P43_009801 [Blastocladiella emersonii ATCC 22665]
MSSQARASSTSLSSSSAPAAAGLTGGAGATLPPNWKAVTDANGRTYYYNKLTRETRWDCPSTGAGTGAPAVSGSGTIATSSTSLAAAATAHVALVDADPAAQPPPRPSTAPLAQQIFPSSSPSRSASQDLLSATANGSGVELPPNPVRKRVADLASQFDQLSSKPPAPAPPSAGPRPPRPARWNSGSTDQLAGGSGPAARRQSTTDVLASASDVATAQPAAPIHDAAAYARPGPPLRTASATEHGCHGSGSVHAMPPLPPPPPPLPSSSSPSSAGNFASNKLPPPPPPLPPPAPAGTGLADMAPLPPPPPPITLPVAPKRPPPAPPAAAIESAPASLPSRPVTPEGAPFIPSPTLAGLPDPVNPSAADAPAPAKPAAYATTPRKLRDSDMGGFLGQLDRTLSTSQGALLGAETVPKSPVQPPLSITLPPPRESTDDHGSTGSASGGPTVMQTPASPTADSPTGSEPDSSASSSAGAKDSAASSSGGGLGIFRRARSPSFGRKKDIFGNDRDPPPPQQQPTSPKDASAPSSPSPAKEKDKDKEGKKKSKADKKDKGSKDLLTDEKASSTPTSPALGGGRCQQLRGDADHHHHAGPKSMVIGAFDLGDHGAGGGDMDAEPSLAPLSAPPALPATTSASPHTHTAAAHAPLSASAPSGRGALSWLFKKSGGGSGSSSAHGSPATPNSASSASPGAGSESLVFGGVLSVLGAHRIPPLVVACIAVVDVRGPQSEGIYRLSGNAAAIQRLRAAWLAAGAAWLAAGAADAPDPDVTAYDVNVVSGTLKLFFRELQEPVLLFDLYAEWIAAGKLIGPARTAAVQAILPRLPPAHRTVLAVLAHHLARLAVHAERTKMDAGNLAIVFGPTLMRPRVESMETILNTEAQNAVVCEMIVNAEAFFGPAPAPALAPASPVSYASLSSSATLAGSGSSGSAIHAVDPATGKLRLAIATAHVPQLPELSPMSPIVFQQQQQDRGHHQPGRMDRV